MCESDDPLRCSRLTLFSTPTSQKLHGTCESYKSFFCSCITLFDFKMNHSVIKLYSVYCSPWCVLHSVVSYMKRQVTAFIERNKKYYIYLQQLLTFNLLATSSDFCQKKCFLESLCYVETLVESGNTLDMAINI